MDVLLPIFITIFCLGAICGLIVGVVFTKDKPPIRRFRHGPPNFDDRPKACSYEKRKAATDRILSTDYGDFPDFPKTKGS